MTDVFPSVAWFQRLADAMAAEPERFRKLGAVDLTLVPRITLPDGQSALFSLEFEGHRCRAVDAPPSLADVRGRHPVVIEGDLAAWREMIENIQTHGRADLTHTLNYLTLPDWPLRLLPVNAEDGQLDVDRFYRYNETLQQFFDGAARVHTRFVENGR
jgi:hypothetical protein